MTDDQNYKPPAPKQGRMHVSMDSTKALEMAQQLFTRSCLASGSSLSPQHLRAVDEVSDFFIQEMRKAITSVAAQADIEIQHKVQVIIGLLRQKPKPEALINPDDIVPGSLDIRNEEGCLRVQFKWRAGGSLDD